MSDIRQEFMSDFWKLLQWGEEHGFKFSPGEFLRRNFTQYTYYEFGFSTIKENGPHGQGRAVDLNVWDGEGYVDINTLSKEEIKRRIKPLSDHWKSLSNKNVCGVDWIKPFDPCHFEKRLVAQR